MSVAGLREHACGKVRRLLDSYSVGELTVETNHEILDHLERCPGCRAEGEARERLREKTRRVAGRLSADPPPELEARVRAALARTPPASPRPVWALALAAAVLLAAGLGLARLSRMPWGNPFGVSPGPSRNAAVLAAYDVAADTQMLCALQLEWPADPPSLAELEERLPARFRPALHAVSAGLSAGAARTLQVMAAHECAHGEKSVLHFVLRRKGERDAGATVSVVAVVRDGGSLASGAVLAEEHVRSDGGDRTVLLTGGRREGFDIVGAESERYLVFVVGSRGPGESLELGRRVLPAVVVALGRA